MPSPRPSTPAPEPKPRPSRPELIREATLEQVLHELKVHQIELEMQNEELRRTHVELDVARSRYFDLYDLAPVGYCTLGERGLIVQANLTAVSLLGMPRNLMLGRALARFVHPESQSALHALLRRLLETGEGQSAELRLLREGGPPFWAHMVVSIAQNEAGERERRVVISDVSARKEAEAARHEGETRYRDLFNRASDGILVCALDGQVVDANESFARMHGFTVSQLAHQNLATVDPERAAISLARLGSMSHGEVLTFEVQHRHRAGHTFWVEVSTSQVQVGGTPRVLGFYRDITERKRLQAGAAQNDRLASMGLLAAGVAHEINNPLTYVLANVEALAEELPALAEGAEPARRAQLDALGGHARNALEGSRRIKKISRALGSFARVEREVLEPVDLNRALEVAATLANTEIKHRARLIKDFGSLPPVNASEGKLTQVFVNLLLNAAQAISEGHADQNAITLRTWSRGDEVFAEISDTGAGIAPENLERVFEPFFTTRAAGGGSGLGLALCRNIMSEFAGELSVSSVPGIGTLFLVQLGASREAVPAAAHLLPLRTPSARGRLLVVDDELQIREVMQRLLGREHEVVTAASGLEAQALLNHDTAFDIILCDLMMPQMTGMELHAWLAARAPQLARRVVFVSGGAFTPSASAYLESVDNLELTKPCDPSELRTLVARFVATPLDPLIGT